MFDPMEHKPMVDEFFRESGEIKISLNKNYITLSSGRVTLYFSLTDKANTIIYDGWETFVGDMGIGGEKIL